MENIVIEWRLCFCILETGQYVNESSNQDNFYDTSHSYQTVPNIKSELPWSPQEYGGEMGEAWSAPDIRGNLVLPGGFRSIQSASPDSNCTEHSTKPMIQAATLAGYSGEWPLKCAVPTDFLAVGRIRGLLVSAPFNVPVSTAFLSVGKINVLLVNATLNVQQAFFLLGEKRRL